MSDTQKPQLPTAQPEDAPAPSAQPDKQAPEEFKNAKEKLYDKIPLTVHQLDVIIVVLVILFFVFYVVGALRGRGIL
ncbi:MAG: hypothetical protein VB021_01685 [Oscillospiraceae bacterium]|nr:hypothetical protein [Oscillospiraceae bacterium]